MEQQQHSELFPDMDIDHIAKQHIRSAASWAMIIVVTTVLGYVVSLLVTFLSKKPAVQQSEGFDITRVSAGGEAVTEIISILIGLFINFFLFRFATQARAAVSDFSQQQMGGAFRSLKIYFMITTILAILVAGLLIIGMVVLAVAPAEALEAI